MPKRGAKYWVGAAIACVLLCFVIPPGIVIIVALLALVVHLLVDRRARKLDAMTTEEDRPRSREPRSEQSTSYEDVATEALRMMGFKLSNYGVGVIVASHMSGYSPHETASMVALMTIARDVRETRDATLLMKIATHATEVIKVLHLFKAQGLMKEEVWANDVNAIKNIAYVGPETREWVSRVLDSDPIAGKERLATRTVSAFPPAD